VTFGTPGTNTYTPSSGRQRRSLAEGSGALIDSVVYDAAGNILLEMQQASYPVRDGCNGGLVARITGSYYAADQHLAVSDVRSNGNPTCVYTQALGTFEETRYDALGRRVLVRSRRDSSGIADGTITRFVWDGNQVSWEIHYPGGDAVRGDSLEVDTAWYAQVCDCGCSHPPQCGLPPDSLPKGYLPWYGRVWYLHVEGMDQPVVIRRFMFGQDTVPFPTIGLYPMYSWKGVPDDGGLFFNRSATFTYHNSTATILWPARNSSAYRRYIAPMEAPSWFGSLTSMSTTDAGTQYMRNRYYDPVAGRFTQEDPLGLAGGLNAYGFADGDPANFGDPFGLDPIPLALPLPFLIGGEVLGGPAIWIGTGILAVTVAALQPGDRNAFSALAVSPVAAQDATYLESRRLGRSDRRETEQENRDANGGVLTCEYCAIGLRPEAGSDNSLEHDHYVPVSTGGETSKDNDRISCRKCNRKFGNRPKPDPRKGKPKAPKQPRPPSTP